MQTRVLLYSTVIASFACSTTSQLFIPSLFKPKSPTRQSDYQNPIMNVPPIPFPPSDKDAPSAPDDSGDSVIISDVIGKERSINIFAGLTRDVDSISARLNDNNQNTTVLAPLNSAIQSLPRKPWEDPRDYGALGESAYDGQAGEDRAHRNLRRFVEAHLVPQSPWKENEKVESVGGSKVWWVSKEGKKYVSDAPSMIHMPC